GGGGEGKGGPVGRAPRGGPRRRDGPRLLAGKMRERFLEDALDRPRRVLLDLPAAESRSDVGENGAISGHRAVSERRTPRRSKTAKGTYSAAKTRPAGTPGRGKASA